MRGDGAVVLRPDVQLQQFNTLRLPSIAQYFAVPERVEDVRDVLVAAADRGLPVTIIGGGSNVVLRSRVPGCVVMPRLLGITATRVDGASFITAGAGVLWHDLVRFSLGQGIGGLENLALIPGFVGAAPIQNIGAYGLELKERFHSLTALSCRDGSEVSMDARQCEFGYRDSVFKRPAENPLLITSVTLRLPAASELRAGYPDVRREMSAMGIQPTAISVAEAVTRVRRRKLPDVRRVPNAGSFFKNPIVDAAVVERLHGQLGNIPTYDDANGIKIPAARLIEAAGWKGKQLGPAAVWHRQPLVLINRGTARGDDILHLADAIQWDIVVRYGVELEIEPAVVGIEE
jgi:UDP-N-acetylmuramate dehydrogenase